MKILIFLETGATFKWYFKQPNRQQQWNSHRIFFWIHIHRCIRQGNVSSNQLTTNLKKNKFQKSQRKVLSSRLVIMLSILLAPGQKCLKLIVIHLALPKVCIQSFSVRQPEDHRSLSNPEMEMEMKTQFFSVCTREKRPHRSNERPDSCFFWAIFLGFQHCSRSEVAYFQKGRIFGPVPCSYKYTYCHTPTQEYGGACNQPNPESFTSAPIRSSFNVFC